mgnify:CR=1 FL=1
MDALRIATMSMQPRDQAQKEREQAVEVAQQFEAVFVRTLVNSLQRTASVGGDGMFGSGPGAATYGDWFDQHFSEQLGRDGGIGITAVLLRDMERHGQIPAEARDAVRTAQRAADRSAALAASALTTSNGRSGGNGGLDVVL